MNFLSKSQAWSSLAFLTRRKTGCYRIPYKLHTTISPLEDVYQELRSLSSQILKYDEVYYNSDYKNVSSEILSDDEYDALVRREAELCKEYPQLLKRWEKESGLGYSATRYGGRVGVRSDSKQRIRHLTKMLSLENVHNTQQLLAWLERIRKKLIKGSTSNEIGVLTEPKLDGLSLSLRYQRRSSKMELEWTATRGDGTLGQDVTEAAREISSIPQVLDCSVFPNSDSDIIEIRGEIVLPLAEFEKVHLNASNARNAASGLLLRKEDLNGLRSKLFFYAYDIVSSGVHDTRTTLKRLGFTIPEPSLISILKLDNSSAWTEADIQGILLYHSNLQQHKNGLEAVGHAWQDYDMDGCVHKIVDRDIREILGVSTRAPRWAIAHKFEPTVAVTEILDVIVQVGRTGALTPVAVLKPIELAGVVIQRATLHNFWHMQHILGGDEIPVGSQVMIRRAGEVIPQVVSRIESGVAETNRPIISLRVPSTCPACGSKAVVVDASTRKPKKTSGRMSVGQVLRCSGSALHCPPRAVTFVQHSFSRGALEVTGLSEARIQQLMDAGVMTVPGDLFEMARTNSLQSKLSSLEGWGERSIGNLQAAALKVAENGVPLERFIFSLGIRHVGLHVSQIIANSYGSADAFLSDVKECLALSNEQVASELSFPRLRQQGPKGIGPVSLASLVSFSLDKDLVEATEKLLNAIKVHGIESKLDGKVDPLAGPFSGLSVVFTGVVPGLSREDAQQVARDMGAKSTPNNVSKSTGLVVAGEKGGSKLEKAKRLGVRVLEADEFVKMVQEIQSKHPR